MIASPTVATREIKHPNTIMRRIVFQHLYQSDARRVLFAQENEFIDQCDREGLDKKLSDRGWKHVGLVFEKLDIVDDVVSTHLKGWTLARIAKVDKAILRMGVTELLYMDTPPSTVMDECVEIAKLYCESESPAFINAVLDRVSKAH